jgi:hypothetical protein
MKQIFQVSQAILVLAVLALVGCGGQTFELAPVKGKVVCQDKPVPGGLVTLVPIAEEGATEMPAPPATGRVDDNGNFELTTQGKAGAAIGKHRVIFTFPEVEKGGEGEGDGVDPEEAKDLKAEQELAAKLAKVPCRRVDNSEFTVAAGENSLTVELATGREED